MNREKTIHNSIDGNKSPSIFISPDSAYASQDTSMNSVQLSGDNTFCLNCGNRIISRKKNARYCSSKCRINYYDKTHRIQRRIYASKYRNSHPKLNLSGMRGKYIRTSEFRNKISLFNKSKGIVPHTSLGPCNPRKYFTIEEIKKAKIEKCKRWRINNPYKMKLIRKKNRALRYASGKISTKIIKQIYEDNIKKYGTLTCYLCEKPIENGNDELEHKIPISKGGTNDYNNLGVSCRKCNLYKGNKTVEEFSLFACGHNTL